MSSQLALKIPAGLETASPTWLPVTLPRHRAYPNSDGWSPASSGEATHSISRALKRFLDAVTACAALIVLSPLMALISLMILMDSPGPVLYRTYRVGKNGRLFRFYKFRTMVANADLLLDEVWNLNERQEILFKTSRDPRLTRLGRVLRRYSLDELPQLWNILKGDMSLVGPRPPMLSEYEQFRPKYRRRMKVLPGMTGLWQVLARNNPSFETYVRLDCHYVDNWNFWLDLLILLKTIPAVLAGTGE